MKQRVTSNRVYEAEQFHAVPDCGTERLMSSVVATCPTCGQPRKDHGQICRAFLDHIMVCPGDWVLTDTESMSGVRSVVSNHDFVRGYDSL